MCLQTIFIFILFLDKSMKSTDNTTPEVNKFSYGMVTPSYGPDFELCRLLCRSIDIHVPSDIHHYLVVPKNDADLFSKLANHRRSIIIEETVLPGWLHKLPLTKKWRLSTRSLPVRSWVCQQIIKMSAPSYTKEDGLV